MDLNKTLTNEMQISTTRKESYIIEINNEAIKENILNNNNKSQSNESLKTTEYSSESSDLISRYLVNKNKKFHNNNNTKDDPNNNITKKTNIGNDVETYHKQEKISKNKKKIKKAPKFEEYKSEYLNHNNTNINPPKIPFIYDIEFKIDNIEKQSEDGEKEFLKRDGITIYNKNYEYKKIARMSHDKLVHLCINDNLYQRKKNLNYNKISVTQRVKHKFLTIIYFSPKKGI